MFTEDLDVFLNTDDFAITATVNGSSVNGIFGDEFVLVDFVESKKPVFSCKLSDVSSVAHGDTAVTSSDTYKVRGIQPDGTGMVKLILERQ
jgi:hypothetical protein